MSSNTCATSDGLVVVTVEADKSAVLRGVQSELNVVLSIASGARQQTVARPPLELALVVDVSGSMSGDKIRFAREGVCAVIDALNLSDVVHLVAYENTARVVFASGNLRDKDRLKKLAMDMEANGGTNIRAGLLQAAKCLDVKPAGSTWAAFGEKETQSVVRDVDGVTRVKRVFLFSDGQANHDNGGADALGNLASELLEAGATTSSFGIGVDFDEVVMDRISSLGHGSYEYIKKPKQVASAVSSALDGIKALLGTGLKLTVRGVGVSVVKRIWGHELPTHAELQDLRANGKKNVVVQLAVMASDAIPSGDSDTVLEYTLSWVTPEGATEELKGTFTSAFTRKLEDVAQNPKASAIVLTLESGLLDNEVVALLDKGDRAAALALKERTVQMLTQAAALDPQGMAPTMLQMAQKNVTHLQSSRSTNKMKKAVAYGGRLQRANSAACLQQISVYANDSDSEEDDEAPPAPQSYQAPPRRRASIVRPGSPTAPPKHQLFDSVSDDDSGD